MNLLRSEYSFDLSRRMQSTLFVQFPYSSCFMAYRVFISNGFAIDTSVDMKSAFPSENPEAAFQAAAYSNDVIFLAISQIARNMSYDSCK